MKWLNKYTDTIAKAQKGKTVTKKNSYKDSLDLYNKGEKEKLQNSKEYPFDKTDNLDITDKNSQAYKDFQKTGIMPTKEYVKNNKFSYGYDKPKEQKKQTLLNIPQQTPLQQIQTKDVVKFNQELSTPITTILPKENIPKYWTIKDTNNQQFGGGDTVYDIYPDTINNLKSLPQELWKRQITPHYKNGGIIEDDIGQWSNPGSVTKINSNNITMRNVNQRLLGISDTGDMQLMFPEQEYKFKGKNVTEFPISKNGKTINKNWLGNY